MFTLDTDNINVSSSRGVVVDHSERIMTAVLASAHFFNVVIEHTITHKLSFHILGQEVSTLGFRDERGTLIQLVAQTIRTYLDHLVR